MSIFEQLTDLEHRKGLYSKEEYETKFKEITDSATDEEILQAAKEAKETLGRGYNIDFFRRKIYSAVIIRYGHKPLKGGYMPGKTRSLLKKLGLYIPKYDFEKPNDIRKITAEHELIFEFKSFEDVRDYLINKNIGVEIDNVKYDYLVMTQYAEIIRNYGEAEIFFCGKKEGLLNHDGNLFLYRNARYLYNRDDKGNFLNQNMICKIK
ncbi:hypothetical protein [Elizabethkingia anophelis]|uniref:hypothetical protein n=1 Tax=Elizabethkingia anophelis TaxID=1117645 RepID=UPI0013193C54|nr:hypothetical protein [Elizabethkingia anophelis]BBQ09250.1 hypothetical protein JUNP353_3821 [Elizabethkingia anophelis]